MSDFKTKYNSIFKDLYNLMADNFPPDTSDAFWLSYGQQAQAVHKKYNDSPFVSDVILAITNELERKTKE